MNWIVVYALQSQIEIRPLQVSSVCVAQLASYPEFKLKIVTKLFWFPQILSPDYTTQHSHAFSPVHY